MKLTQDHIDELYKFTKKHYVDHYDVQSELVDHLANDIEQIWVAQPLLTFEEAQDKAFKKFGVFGFMEVVEKKKWQMTKKYFKTILKFAKEWFRLPKIILTLLLFIGFYQLQKIPNAYTIYITIFIIVALFQLVLLFKNRYHLQKTYKETGKKWMFQDIIAVQGLGHSFLLLLYFFRFPFSNVNDFLNMGDFRRVFSAFLITFLIIFGYITLILIPKKAQKLLEEAYPEFKLI